MYIVEAMPDDCRPGLPLAGDRVSRVVLELNICSPSCLLRADPRSSASTLLALGCGSIYSSAYGHVGGAGRQGIRRRGRRGRIRFRCQLRIRRLRRTLSLSLITKLCRPELTDVCLLPLQEEEEFYTEPPLPDQLLAARRKIARFSLPLSAERLRRQRLEAVLPVGKILDVRKGLYKSLKVSSSAGIKPSCLGSAVETDACALSFSDQTTVLLGSQIGDTRPISTIRFSPDAKMVATGSWSGGAKVWDVPGLNEVKALKGQCHLSSALIGEVYEERQRKEVLSTRVHSHDRGPDDRWHLTSFSTSSLNQATTPTAEVSHGIPRRRSACPQQESTSQPEEEREPSSCGVSIGQSHHPRASRPMLSVTDELVRVALYSPTPLSTLEGHTAPVARVAFHPSGDYVASASFDGTWRLWDVETSESMAIFVCRVGTSL